MNGNANLENSVIVAAHPDDEVLWFSSILSKVDQVILCYLDVASKPVWTKGRRESLRGYPLDNAVCLEIPEAEVFYGADWTNPVTTDYGLAITEEGLSDYAYRDNYETLAGHLRERLRGYRNVFTHNPWGEYGHVEHVQVYRAVRSLQDEMGFNLWFSGYASTKSALLLSRQIPEIAERMRLPTDLVLADRLMQLYKANDCWTWYDDYSWPEDEVFVRAAESLLSGEGDGAVLPVNLINVGIVERPSKKSVKRSPLLARLKGWRN
jgi:LmbE family N-acetylglucosaminyl deacetylase